MKAEMGGLVHLRAGVGQVLGKSSKKQKQEEPAPVRGSGSESGSLISRGMRVVGDCRTDGGLRIEGAVSGNVIAGSLTVAASGSVDGDVALGREAGGDGEIVVDGAVSGSVEGKRVEVGPDGKIDGGLVATEARVRGRVQGGILAERRLMLEDTAVVEGDVRARRLALKEGGRVNGNIRMGEAATETTGGAGKGPEPPGMDDAERARDRRGARASAAGETGGDAEPDGGAPDRQGVQGPDD